MKFTCPRRKRLDTYATYREGGTCVCVCGKGFRPHGGSGDEECKATVPSGQAHDDEGFKP